MALEAISSYMRMLFFELSQACLEMYTLLRVGVLCEQGRQPTLL